MSKYATRQRTKLLGFLMANADTALNARQISLALETEKISISSVYRYLSDLEKEGKIRRITKANERTAYFQYADHENCRNHIHLVCSVCGRTTHLDIKNAYELIGAARNISGFTVDLPRSVIYGLCKDCGE